MALVERGKVWVALPSAAGCLRDVPVPRETVPGGEGPAVWIFQGASEPREEMLGASPVVDHAERGWWRRSVVTFAWSRSNRERELGLDRRETG